MTYYNHHHSKTQHRSPAPKTARVEQQTRPPKKSEAEEARKREKAQKDGFRFSFLEMTANGFPLPHRRGEMAKKYAEEARLYGGNR